MTTDPNVADPVKLAAIKDALDRGGLAAKNAVSVEVGLSKPFERVFDSIMAGPRDPKKPPALAIEDDTAPAIEPNGEILGEFDDDPEPDEIEDDPLRIHRERERESAEIVDVEVVAAGYTDEIMSGSPGTATLDQDQSQPDEHTVPPFGPLGMNGPVGSGLMSITEANEAVAEMRARQAARIRDINRR